MAAVDVKDVFCMGALKEEDQEKFAVAWDGIQYTLSRLPQGYEHSPATTPATLAEL